MHPEVTRPYLSTFLHNQEVKWGSRLRYVFNILFHLVLIYLPVLIARKNFSSYRTMLCLNLAGTFLLTHAFLSIIKSDRLKDIFIYAASLLVLVVAYYNFNYNYLNPLKNEYRKLQAYVKDNYTPDISTIYFIRPPESIFKSLYQVNVYKDEFGEPSTFKDWTPIPLMKQLVFEITGSRQKADQVNIINISAGELTEKPFSKDRSSLLIDMQDILGKK